jgi:hypothetical protein
VFSPVAVLKRNIHARAMEHINDINLAAGAARSTLLSMRAEVRALIALGWVPSPDEPWRVYSLRGDTFSTMTTQKVWSAMHELLSEAKP